MIWALGAGIFLLCRVVNHLLTLQSAVAKIIFEMIEMTKTLQHKVARENGAKKHFQRT